jgi:heptosyltransferase I
MAKQTSSGKPVCPNPPERILIVKLSAIGDVLMATPAASALRKAYPDAYIAWVVERKSSDVVIGNPYVDEVIVWDRGKRRGFITDTLSVIVNLASLGRELRKRRFDVALDLQGLLRSAGVCLASGATQRYGFSDAAEGAPRLYHRTYTPEAGNLNAQQRNLDLLREVGVVSTDTAMHMPVTAADDEFAHQFFAERGLEYDTVVGFLPATTWVNKHWVPESWAELADILATEYRARPLIFGSKADIALAEKICGMTSKAQPVIAAGHTTLKGAGALMKRCTAVVGVDTGLLHMSVALDRPTVGLFGASVWKCFLKRDNFVWISKDFPCMPCLRHPTCSDVDCMRAITAGDVVDGVSRFLRSGQ